MDNNRGIQENNTKNNLGYPLATTRQGSYLESKLYKDYPTMLVDYKDTFDRVSGMSGWHYHNQYNQAAKRGSPTLSKTARRSDFSLTMYTGNAQSAQTWARKSQGGDTLPANAKKVIIFHEWAWHAWWLYGMYAVNFSVDIQIGSSSRKWYKVRWVRSISGTGGPADNKWQYDSTGQDSNSWVDVPNGAEVISWNEPYKQMFSSMAMVIDLEKQVIEKLYSNNNEYNLSAQTIAAGTVLDEYQNGVNHALWLENRAAGTTNMASFHIDLAGLAYVF